MCAPSVIRSGTEIPRASRDSRAAKYGVELLANLGAVPPAGAMVVVGGPKHRGASGGPVRVFAVA